MVPFPLAAGPSTAIMRSRCGLFRDVGSSAKAAALTGAYAYGKARRRTQAYVRPQTTFYWS